ncbi:MAG: PAS domain-containing protein [Elusimicrobiaceae bacterium]
MRKIIPLIIALSLCACALLPRDSKNDPALRAFAQAYIENGKDTNTPQTDTPFIITAMDGTILYANTAFERFSQYPMAELAGNNYYRILITVNSAASEQNALKAIGNGQPVKISSELINKDGMSVCNHTTMNVVLDGQGKPSAILRILETAIE